MPDMNGLSFLKALQKQGTIIPVVVLTADIQDTTSHECLKLGAKEVIQGLFKDISKEKMVLELKKEIMDKKLVEQAKGILMDHYKISEKEAKRRLQKESRRQRKKIGEIAQAVISSELILK